MRSGNTGDLTTPSYSWLVNRWLGAPPMNPLPALSPLTSDFDSLGQIVLCLGGKIPCKLALVRAAAEPDRYSRFRLW